MLFDYRDEFPVTKTWAYLNHANVAPLSRRAQERLCNWSIDVASNGDITIGEWFTEIENVRQTVARIIHASSCEIAFLKNTSEGVSLVAEGFPWSHGDNVIICGGDYPANVYPWMHVARLGVAVRLIGGTDGKVSLTELASVVDERTRIVAVSFVHFASGYRNDLAAIGEFCRANNIDFFVDAIQGLGAIQIDVREMYIDYLCANSQKWLVSPQGAAIFYINESKIEKIEPISVGWKSVAMPHKYSQIDFQLRRDACRYECGSFIVPSIIALGGSLSLFEEVGLGVIQEHVKSVTDYLVECLASIGATVESDRTGESWSGIVSFSMPAVDPDEAVIWLRNHKVVISARAGRLRASPHFYNTRDDIDRLINCLLDAPPRTSAFVPGRA
jgi:cysteine desulfurase/selenocysteine lyase